MAVNKPIGDNARKGAVRKRSQLQTKTMGKKSWTKRSKATGQFIDQKKGRKKFKGVRMEK
jgi:hypothetical protein